MRAEELWKAYCEKENIDIDTPIRRGDLEMHLISWQTLY